MTQKVIIQLVSYRSKFNYGPSYVKITLKILFHSFILCDLLVIIIVTSTVSGVMGLLFGENCMILVSTVFEILAA